MVYSLRLKTEPTSSCLIFSTPRRPRSTSVATISRSLTSSSISAPAAPGGKSSGGSDRYDATAPTPGSRPRMYQKPNRPTPPAVSVSNAAPASNNRRSASRLDRSCSRSRCSSTDFCQAGAVALTIAGNSNRPQSVSPSPRFVAVQVYTRPSVVCAAGSREPSDPSITTSERLATGWGS